MKDNHLHLLSLVATCYKITTTAAAAAAADSFKIKYFTFEDDHEVHYLDLRDCQPRFHLSAVGPINKTSVLESFY